MKSTIEAMKHALIIISYPTAYTAPVILALQQAIAREEARSVEAYAWIYECGTIGGYDYRLEKERIIEGHYADSAMWIETPLFAHPLPATAPTSGFSLLLRREALIVSLRRNRAPLANMAADMLANDTQTIAELENRVEACEYSTNSTGLRKQIAALKADKQELENELARVKAKWQDDYLTLNDVCNQQIELEAAAKLALDAMQIIRRIEDMEYGSIAKSGRAIEALKKAGIK